ncbi:MAG: hypothetical protein KJI71_00485 [Patescibacteria group bacterium]|nr:hypothetical protein [Patescibacteria group bacterium]
MKIIITVINIEIEGKEDDGLCPECKGKIWNNGFELICRDCGLVINPTYKKSSFIHNNSEIKDGLSKQFVALGKRPDFVGGLGTFMDYENTKYIKDKCGKLLRPNGQKLFRRLKKNYDQLSRIKGRETEYRVFNILNKVALALNLNSNIRNNSAYYFQKIINSGEKIINNISLIAFSIFYAIRKEYHNAPITIRELSKTFQELGHRVNPRLILRDGMRYRHLIHKETAHHKSEDYLTRLLSEVINHKCIEERLKKKKSLWTKQEYLCKLTKTCRIVLKNLTQWQRGGRHPFILAGATIYLADKLVAKEFGTKAVLTQSVISEATKIAEYSIRDHYVNLLKPIFYKE